MSVERRSTPRLPTPLWVVRRCRARPPTLKKLIIDETEKWAKVIMFGGIKAD